MVLNSLFAHCSAKEVIRMDPCTHLEAFDTSAGMRLVKKLTLTANTTSASAAEWCRICKCKIARLAHWDGAQTGQLSCQDNQQRVTTCRVSFRNRPKACQHLGEEE